jgi:hypothetical protein
MKFESFNAEENLEEERSHEMLLLNNKIQKELIQHACAPDENMDKCVNEWISIQAPYFEVIFKSMASSNRNLLEEWETNPTLVLDEIHSKLYEMQRLQEPEEDIRRAA